MTAQTLPKEAADQTKLQMREHSDRTLRSSRGGSQRLPLSDRSLYSDRAGSDDRACGQNAILIVEFARELKAEGMATVEAAVEATRQRFRPILMTSIAFILGVVPLLTATGAGAASQQALGTVVFGGMLASTLLAIPFVPIFHILTQSVSEKIGARGMIAESKSPQV